MFRPPRVASVPILADDHKSSSASNFNIGTSMTSHQLPATSQTRSFMTIVMTELWERFGYYGMQALIVYYMVQRLGFEDSRANLVWGACAALIYVSPAIGGWIGDKVLGTKRSMIIGALILTIGYALMAVPTVNT